MKDAGAGPVKSSWITRRFPPDLAITWDRPRAPQPGHVLMAQVVRLGLHGRHPQHARHQARGTERAEHRQTCPVAEAKTHGGSPTWDPTAGRAVRATSR